jgi:predicted RND superfamily exporter protein
VSTEGQWRAATSRALGVIALVAAVSFALGPSALDLRILVEERDMLVQGDDQAEREAEIRRRFGDDGGVVVGFETPGRELLAESLDAYRAFARAVFDHPYLSLLFVDPIERPRFAAGEGGGRELLVRPALDRIRREAETCKLFPTLHLTRSGTGAIAVFPSLGSERERTVAAEVRRLFDTTMPPIDPAARLRLAGPVVVHDALGAAIEEDLTRLVPLVFGVLLILLGVLFRSPVAALIAISEIGLCTLWTLALLGRAGHDLSLMTSLLPILIAVIGIADEIHLFAEFYRRRSLSPWRSRGDLVLEATRAVFVPVSATSLTTALALGSLVVTDIAALRIFGFWCAVGVGLSWLLTLTWVPALLILIPIGDGPRWTRVSSAHRRPRKWLRPVALTLSLPLVAGVFALETNDGWTGNFPADHPVVEDLRWLESESVGLHRFDVVLSLPAGQTWEEPIHMARLAELQEEIRTLDGVRECLSVVDLVRDRRWELAGGEGSLPEVPGTRLEIAEALRSFALFNETVLLRAFLDRGKSWTSLWTFLEHDDFRTAAAVQEQLRKLLPSHLAPGEKWRLGGSAERGRHLIDRLVIGQTRAVLTSTLLCLAALVLLFGRWKRALLCIGAILWALLLLLGVIGWTGVELGVASSCFLGLSLGVGLDYSIHLAYGRAGVEAGPEERGQMRARVLSNVLVVGAGLCVLLLSINPTIQKLGSLIVLGMIVCALTSLLVLGRSTPER